MYGAIVGDLAGSIYEFDQLKKVHRVQMNNLIEDNAFYSDDTILTIGILDAILNNKDYDYFYENTYKNIVSINLILIRILNHHFLLT